MAGAAARRCSGRGEQVTAWRHGGRRGGAKGGGLVTSPSHIRRKCSGGFPAHRGTPGGVRVSPGCHPGTAGRAPKPPKKQAESGPF